MNTRRLFTSVKRLNKSFIYNVEEPPPFNTEILLETATTCVVLSKDIIQFNKSPCNHIINKLTEIVINLRTDNVNNQWFSKLENSKTFFSQILDIIYEYDTYTKIFDSMEELKHETVKTIQFIHDKLDDDDKKLASQFLEYWKQNNSREYLQNTQGVLIPASKYNYEIPLKDSNNNTPEYHEEIIQQSHPPNPFAKGNIKPPNSNCIDTITNLQKQLDQCRAKNTTGGRRNNKHKRKYTMKHKKRENLTKKKYKKR